MTKVCSEDSVRRAFQRIDPEACLAWQSRALQRSWLPALNHPWVLDLDVTVKPVYGHQEGASKGYNPHKPGRPSHAYHTLMIRHLRLVLDVEVRSGKEHAAGHGSANLWRVLDDLPPECRPQLVCGDAGFGNEDLAAACELRRQNYLFRLRLTRGVRKLVQMLEIQGGWKRAIHGWEGIEGTLQLQGWTRSRRVVVYRRLTQRPSLSGGRKRIGQDELGLAPLQEAPDWEYQVLVSNLETDLVGLCDLYRQRADIENAYDELKNQWGWGGFMTRDLLRCQVSARNVALIYNWWSLFVACAQPERGREATTSRPLLLCAVGRVVESGRQLTLRLTSTHAHAAQAQSLLSAVSLFLSGLTNAAEQLDPKRRWQRIWDRILSPWLKPQATLGFPSG